MDSFFITLMQKSIDISIAYWFYLKYGNLGTFRFWLRIQSIVCVYVNKY